MKVYVAQVDYDSDSKDELIGVYSSLENAQNAASRYHEKNDNQKPGSFPQTPLIWKQNSADYFVAPMQLDEAGKVVDYYGDYFIQVITLDDGNP